jgi:O-antigen/teichoic acid export membrane protein
MVAFANLIDKQALGTYQYLLAAASIIGAFSLSGAPNAIVRAISKKHFADTAKLFTLSLYSSIIPVAIATIAGIYYLVKGNAIAGYGIIGGTVAYVSLAHILRYNAAYLGLQKFKEANQILKIRTLAPLFFVLPLLFFLPNPALLAIAYFGGSAIAISLLLTLTGGRAYIKHIVRTPTANEATEDSVPFALHQSIIQIINVGTSHLDKVLIFQLLGGPATAIYYIATSIPDRLRDMIKQFEPFLFSKFANHSIAAAVQGVAGKFWFIVFSAVPIYLAYIIAAPFVYSYILPQYADTLALTLIYGLTIMSGAAIVPYSALKAHSTDKVFYYYTIFQSATRLSFLLIGSVVAGLNGVIIGVTISTTLNSIALLYIVKRHKQI